MHVPASTSSLKSSDQPLEAITQPPICPLPTRAPSHTTQPSFQINLKFRIQMSHFHDLRLCDVRSLPTAAAAAILRLYS